ncbi:MAG: 5-oxoprolinase subunit PxpA [Candidatus Bathyarchaeota archaeon]|nr:5-oxoprolinase subunit PxpA [Candidatus Bathyarchaeota archaeon]
MKYRVDINSDLGESFGAYTIGNDAQLMRHITSANIACGFHASDPTVMAQTIKLAKKHRVAVGAHPGYPDLAGFGRREMKLTSEEIENSVVYQTGALAGFAKTEGLALQHVKPHGALYNKAAEDEQTAKAIVNAVKSLDPNLIIFAPPNSVLAKTAADRKMRVAAEFFADRAYNPDQSLVSRAKPNAIFHDSKKILERTVKAVTEGVVETIDNKTIKLGKIHSICIHGDTPSAVKLVETLRKGLAKAKIEIKAVGTFI